jgi:hypothetical protein
MTTSFRLMGDPHIGKVFLNNVPLHRRGDHEKIVWAEFEKQLDPVGAAVHINLGDLFDKPFVPYSIVWRAAQLYEAAAYLHPNTTFIVLRGNHDASRDLEAISAFDIFEGLVATSKNIHCITSWYHHGDMVFFGWNPVQSASEIVEAFVRHYNKGHRSCKGWTAFGHLDVDPRSDPFNLIPTKQLAAAGITKAYTGHDHIAREFTRDGVDVVVVGSMLAYAHGEGDPYVTLTLDEARAATDLLNKCVRIMLAPGEVFDLEIDCLQLQVERLGVEDDPIEVELGEFDLGGLFEASMTDADVPDHIKAEVRTEWHKSFSSKQ